MSEKPRTYTWRIEATIPGTWKNQVTGEERPTTKNLNLQVVAPTLDDVVAAVKHRHRDTTVTFIKIMRDRYIDDVIVVDES